MTIDYTVYFTCFQSVNEVLPVGGYSAPLMQCLLDGRTTPCGDALIVPVNQPAATFLYIAAVVCMSLR